jgi:hypothetical protein
MLYPCFLHLHIPFGQLGPFFKEKRKKELPMAPTIILSSCLLKINFSCENGVYGFFKQTILFNLPQHTHLLDYLCKN